MIRRSLRRARAVSRLVRAQPSGLAYLGWAGQGNVGDDAILAGQRLLRGDGPMTLLPVHDMPAVLAGAVRLRPRLASTDILLGGGTLVGRPEWLTRLRHVLDISPRARVYVWGAGVEDPTFSGARQHVSRESLREWADVLAAAGSIGVRGPRSRDILHGLDIDARVVGDPALALEPRGRLAARAGTVALNLAATEDTYASAQGNWRDVVLDDLQALDVEVDLFTMDPKDEALARRICAERPGLVRSVRSSGGPQQVIDWLSTCQMVVSERLHGSVLAAAAGRPFVSLDYRPKCADFADSVGMGEFNVKVDELRPGHVGDLVGALTGPREVPVRTAMAECVADLRSRLAEAPYQVVG